MIRSVLVAVASAAALSACVGLPAEGTGPIPMTPTTRLRVSIAAARSLSSFSICSARVTPTIIGLKGRPIFSHSSRKIAMRSPTCFTEASWSSRMQ